MTLSTFLAQVSVDPKVSELPGSPVLQKLINGLSGWGTMICLAGLLLAGVAMAMSRHFQNGRYEEKSKTAALASAGGAILIAAAAPLINWATALGSSVR